MDDERGFLVGLKVDVEGDPRGLKLGRRMYGSSFRFLVGNSKLQRFSGMKQEETSEVPHPICVEPTINPDVANAVATLFFSDRDALSHYQAFLKQQEFEVE